jgi:D-serine deaminase-like pyridoxal phosphate-dependent protein
MVRKARESGVSLRPHFKTHQSADVAAWLRDLGVRPITVSSLEMAEYFSRSGWDDITVAVPVNIHQIPKIDALARSVTLHVIIDSEFAAVRLKEGMAGPLNVWVEIDTGDHRTGIPAKRIDQVLAVARIVGRAPGLRFQGILTHDGHTYDTAGAREILAIHEKSRSALQNVKQALEAGGFSPCLVSVGDTPSSTLVDRFLPPISEVRPGNFVFYDLKQKSMGVCRDGDIAGAAAFPVISTNLPRKEVVVYGGSVHMSRESLPLPSGRPFFGQIARLAADQGGWTPPLPGVYLSALSQEHGIVSGPEEFIRSVEIGATLVVLPVHACITASLYSEYHVLGDGVAKKFRP